MSQGNPSNLRHELPADDLEVGTEVRLLPRVGTIEAVLPVMAGRTKATANRSVRYRVRFTDGQMLHLTADFLEGDE